MRKHLHHPTANDGKLIDIFFWNVGPRVRKPINPADFVHDTKKPLERLALAGILSTGEVIAKYRGISRCLMPNCPIALGSSDLAAFGYRFPQGCEHYVLMHSVWVPGCDALIELAVKELK